MAHKIKYRGRETEADMVEASQSNEKWNEYLLEDGSVLKIKLVLKKAFRLRGEYDPEGNPLYVVESQNVLTVNCPDDLKRK